MTLTAPWYSGMAQGQALSLVSRLWSVTGDTRWRDAATSIVATYRADGPGDGPWFAHVIAGDLWFEEYPDARGTVAPTQVVNGHVYRPGASTTISPSSTTTTRCWRCGTAP